MANLKEGDLVVLIHIPKKYILNGDGNINDYLNKKFRVVYISKIYDKIDIQEIKTNSLIEMFDSNCTKLINSKLLFINGLDKNSYITNIK